MNAENCAYRTFGVGGGGSSLDIIYKKTINMAVIPRFVLTMLDTP